MLWDTNSNGAYNNRVTGIGRDDIGAQNQKQSKSQGTGANVAIVLGDSVAATNTANKETFENDKSFFVFGDNGKEANFEQGYKLTKDDTVAVKTLERVYKIQKTNWDESKQITLQVDKIDDQKGYPLYLIVSSSDTFVSDAAFYPVNQADGTVTLNSSEIDNGNYFTFASAYPLPDSAQLALAEVDGADHSLNLSFDREVDLDNLEGFVITVGDTSVDLSNAGYRVDPNDKTKLIIDLSEGDLASGEAITVSYDGTGTLRDLESGVAADVFSETLNAVNKVALQNKVKEALSLTEADYTESSWQAMQVALEAANSLLDKADATQEEVNTALDNLQTAIDGLVKKPPIAEGGSFTEGTNKITLDFNKAVKFDQSQGGSSVDGFTVTVGENEITAVTAAVDPADPTKVILTLPEGTELSKSETVHVYYEAAFGHLQGDEDNGKAVEDFDFEVKDPFAAALTVTGPSGVTNDLQPAVTGTAPKDADSVTITIAGPDGNPIQSNTALTVDPVTGAWSFDTYETNLAPGVYTVTVTATKGGQTATEIHTFTIVDKTALQSKADEAQGYHEEDWTSETWDNYQEAFTAATAVLTDDGATQQEVDNALTALQTAQAGLRKAPPIPVNPESFTEGTTSITIPFDRALAVDEAGNPKDGFSVTYVGEDGNLVAIDVTNAEISEINGSYRITLDIEQPLSGDWTVTVAYDEASGHLKGEGEDSSSVADFRFELVDPFAAELKITAPSGTTSDKTPTISGTVHTDADELTVTLKDAEGKLVEVGGQVNWVAGISTWYYNFLKELPPGTYTIEATAVDGERSVTKTRTFTITEIVDKTALQAEVDLAEGLNEAYYTPESWNAYQTQLEQAQVVLADDDATQAEVNTALRALTAAREGLVSDSGHPIANGVTLDKSNPDKLILTFDQPVKVTSDQLNGFAISGGRGAISVTQDVYELSEDGLQLILHLDRELEPGEEISLTYDEDLGNIVAVGSGKGLFTFSRTVIRPENTGGGSDSGSGSSGGSSKGNGGSSSNNTNVSSGPVTKTIVVDVVIGGDEEADITKVPIDRTTYADGRITDKVTFTKEKAQETIDKALETGKNIARILIPDAADEVSEVNLTIPAESVALLQANAIDFEVYNPNVFIQVPAASLQGLEQDFYFRLVPVKDRSEREEIELRAQTEQVVREWAADDNIEVVARPMTIETNLSSRPVTLTLPLRDVELPEDAKERAAFLAQLGIFIEHTNGEKEVVKGTPVTMPDGQLGLQFSIDQFSTFTIIDFNHALSEGQHTPYVQGFPDGQFKPLENVTRGQLAAMLARNLGYVEGTWSGEAPFKDVPETSWQAGVIAFIKEQGLMQGMPDGSFKPNDAVTRAEIATVMVNYRNLAVVQDSETSFNDIAGHWAQWNINAVREAGLIEGFQDGSFKPNDYASRAEAVVMLNRMFERGPLNGVTAPSFPDVPAGHWAFEHIEEAATAHSYIIDAEQKEVIAE
ncbi:S-layer homology domain-containing protein [Paenibacillus sp. M1]|uniref:S-layer homology domain-containing protein n=1 Tax=Paenibacillus haidiansis TaxID=1574488 RepID=A0ABU7VZ36_9BACL